MRRICFVLAFCACSAHSVFAQSDYAKHELGATVSIAGADTKGAFNNDKSRDGLNGFSIQSAYNISRYWGLKGEFSYFQKQFVSGSADATSRLTQIMGGIKLQDNANTTRFRPFAQALIGLAHTSTLPRVLEETSTSRTVAIISGTGPAFVLGGGLDIRLTKKLDLRALQIDYNPVRAKGETFQNVRIGIGLNFRF
ncbi:MAG: outer membrane beta-barrel protein [Acidobacteriota bacterium]